MSNLQIFQSPEWGSIRTVDLDGTPWLVGKDVAQALGYSDTDQALRRHVDAEDKLTRSFDGSGQSRTMTIINESGLYSLVLSSKLPSARRFRRWITSEVLPSIRKTGGYAAGNYKDEDLAAISKMWSEQTYWSEMAEKFDQVARESRRQYEESRAQRDQCRARAKQAAACLTGLMTRIDLERGLCDG